ncbi:hypothetical protein IW261DRAFT_631968 [Armillaria novae-zelandiae]|uniref:ZZ-type domain-containing protein n=1 Tax=Armillaria novae-zelandiae TaxID=153914 RepID=A0AA39PP59_9AGAR|nr:hypothetical protein IW261DRAFT_631968 [Armillaria novae-zelandiae]
MQMRTYLKWTFSSYGHASKILLKGLKLCAKVHPIAEVVVGTFEVVFAFEVMRQENNRKVGILRLRMQDLLVAIFQLRNLQDREEISPDGKRVNVLRSVMKKIAEDIKEAASACDFYMSKKLIYRVIKSLQYESVFAEHIAMLTEDRKRLEMSLNTRTAQVNERMLASIHADIKKMSERQLICLDTTREQDLRKFLKTKGGPDTWIEDENILRELLQKCGDSIESVLGRQSGSKESWSEVKKKVQKEMAEDVKKALGEHFEHFQTLLDLQGQQLTDIKKNTDEIKAALDAGPHDRIVDADFKKLWKDMAWRKSVNAQRFVSALYEHLIEKLDAGEYDQWVLDYLNSAYLQPLLEAVDDDATGFVTTREINTFVESMPKNWTLLQWIAYWAAGWQFSVTRYKRSIYKLMSEMYGIYPQVLPTNRNAVIRYLRDDVIFHIDKLLQSTHSPPSNAFESEELRKLVTEFTEVEEERLHTKLKRVRYNIDAQYIVSLVTGPGRIERYIYPILYLLLRRHYGVLALAAKETLHPEEIADLTISLGNLFSVVNQRLENLTSIFQQNNVDVEEKLKNFAFGMFKLYHEYPEKNVSNNRISEYIHKQSFFDENVEPLEVRLEDLVYYDQPSEATRPSSFPAGTSEDPIQGSWAGHAYDRGISKFGLIQLSIKSSPEGTLTGEAVTWQFTLKISGKIRRNNQVIIHLDFGRFNSKDLIGQFDAEKGIIEGRWGEYYVPGGSEEEDVKNSDEEALKDAEENKDEDQVLKDVNELVVAYSDEETATQPVKLGAIETLPDDATDLEFAASDDDASQGPQYTFVLRRMPASLWRFLPSGLLDSPVAAGSLARARWSFALKCVLDRIKREISPGGYFVEQFIEAVRFIILARRELYEDEKYCPRLGLSAEEEEELEQLKCAIFPEFIGPYYALVKDTIDQYIYPGYGCDSCDGRIVGTRWACLTCMNDSFTDTVDLCASCVKESVELRGFIHNASHVLLKCDTYVMDADWQWIIPRARLMVVRIKKEFRSRSKLRTELADESDNTQSKDKPSCQACHKEVSLPCWVRIIYWSSNEGCYLCARCGREAKTPATDSFEYGLPLLQLEDNDAQVEAVTTELRLATLEKKMDQQLAVMTKLLEKFSPPVV